MARAESTVNGFCVVTLNASKGECVMIGDDVIVQAYPSPRGPKGNIRVAIKAPRDVAIQRANIGKLGVIPDGDVEDTVA